MVGVILDTKHSCCDSSSVILHTLRKISVVHLNHLLRLENWSQIYDMVDCLVAYDFFIKTFSKFIDEASVFNKATNRPKTSSKNQTQKISGK